MSPALKMGFELLRPWGVISSVGVHNAEVLLVFCLKLLAFCLDLLSRKAARG